MAFLRRIQQYFSYIMATAHIVHVLFWFHQYYTGALKWFAQGQSHEKPRGFRTPGLRAL